jgi:hypothetical protein
VVAPNTGEAWLGNLLCLELLVPSIPWHALFDTNALEKVIEMLNNDLRVLSLVIGMIDVSLGSM